MISNLKLKVISYSFAALSFFIFIYCFFFSDEEAYKSQAIYWFYGSLIITLIPQISQLKYGDLELTLRKELRKAEENIETNLSSTLGKVENSIQKSEQNVEDVFQQIEKSFQELDQRTQSVLAADTWLKVMKVELVNSLKASDYPEVNNMELFRDDLLPYIDGMRENLRQGIFGVPSRIGLKKHLSNSDLYIKALRAIKNHSEVREEQFAIDASVRSMLDKYMKAFIRDIPIKH